MINFFKQRNINEQACIGVKIMKNKRNLGALLLSALVLIAALVFIDNVLSRGENHEWSRVVFYVS
jgi:hypothetical protein